MVTEFEPFTGYWRASHQLEFQYVPILLVCFCFFVLLFFEFQELRVYFSKPLKNYFTKLTFFFNSSQTWHQAFYVFSGIQPIHQCSLESWGEKSPIWAHYAQYVMLLVRWAVAARVCAAIHPAWCIDEKRSIVTMSLYSLIRIKHWK